MARKQCVVSQEVIPVLFKSGSGTLKSTFLDLAFILTINWNPFSGELIMQPLLLEM